ncbi:carboxypeptidase-like regulatory domain-containing protein [Aurantibacter sp.]|uniref:carboxypeptidase-like regulatory domain-containing protein n=1 Tax=Aurantibacter sp. TaxID=2807103 RepID=UPI003262F4BE
MKNILALVVLFFSTGLFAQQGAIRGTILDQEMNNEPLLLANISLKGDNISKQTNLFGNFELDNVQPGDYIVQISFAGYNTKEVAVNVVANETIVIQETLSALTFEFDDTTLNSKASNEEKIAANTSRK